MKKFTIKLRNVEPLDGQLLHQPARTIPSARSAASVWTTSSSSMSGIFAESVGPTSRTISGLARTSRSARMLRGTRRPTDRPHRSATRSRRSAPLLRTASRLIALGCTGMRPSLDVEVCPRARSRTSPERNRPPTLVMALLGWPTGHLSRRAGYAGRSRQAPAVRFWRRSGGVRSKDSPEYATILKWINGAKK